MELQGKRASVIGGAGFIGSHVTEKLLRKDVAEVISCFPTPVGSRNRFWRTTHLKLSNANFRRSWHLWMDSAGLHSAIWGWSDDTTV